VSEDRPNFITGNSSDERELFIEALDIGLEFHSGKGREYKVLNYKSPQSLQDEFSYEIPLTGSSNQTILESLRYISKYSIAQSDVNYIAFPDSANSIHAMMGDIVAKFINQNLIAFDRSAPIASIVEMQLLEWLRQLVGYDYRLTNQLQSLADVGGMWTTGGHMSNHIAILTALHSKYPAVREVGIGGLPVKPKIIVAGDISHYSIPSAINHLGLGSESIINVRTNPDFTTNTVDLERVLQEHKDKDDVFMVVTVAGNTRTSSIDNLGEINSICNTYGVWAHVDACHGGSLLFSDKLRQKYLYSIERADSITIDPHKGMFVTYPSSYVLFKKRDSLVHFTRYENEVRNGHSWDLGYITPFFGSRGFESLKLWSMIKALGKKYLSDTVERRDSNSKWVAETLNESDYFIMLHDVSFYRMVFVYFPRSIKQKIDVVKGSLSADQLESIAKIVNAYTHTINEFLYKGGELSLDEFGLRDIGNVTNLDYSDKYKVMCITIGNPNQSQHTLKKSLAILFRVAKNYIEKMDRDVERIIKGKSGQTVNPQDIDSHQEQTGPAGW